MKQRQKFSNFALESLKYLKYLQNEFEQINQNKRREL